MRYVRILLLHFQQVFEQRSRVFVYFLSSLVNPLTLLWFWSGAHLEEHLQHNNAWTLSSITSYYLLLGVFSALLMSHPEDDVAKIDIQEGNLVAYLLRPFSYFIIRFVNSSSYRILQGIMGFSFLFFLFLLYGKFITIVDTPSVILFSIVITILAYFLAFVYKMILGIIAFWIIDINGIFNVSEIILFVFAGYVIPLHFLPQPLQQISYTLPFAYMIYFPVIAFQGKLSTMYALEIISIQLLWIGILFAIYKLMWQKGVQKFSGVGQ